MNWVGGQRKEEAGNVSNGCDILPRTSSNHLYPNTLDLLTNFDIVLIAVLCLSVKELRINKKPDRFLFIKAFMQEDGT
jgi:hypothetical protein